MREFSFAPAGDWNKYDAKSGKCPAVWDSEDVRHAMEAHANRFGLVPTLAVLKEITGLDARQGIALHMPTRYYGPLIAQYCFEMAQPTKVLR
jgi:hypothetical protein